MLGLIESKEETFKSRVLSEHESYYKRSSRSSIFLNFGLVSYLSFWFNCYLKITYYTEGGTTRARFDSFSHCILRERLIIIRSDLIVKVPQARNMNILLRNLGKCVKGLS